MERYVENNVVILHMKYCITCSVLYIIIFAAAVKSQQTITCFVAADCDINQPSQTIQSSNAVGECCNYPSAGVRPRGFAYVGQGTCTPCPLSMFSIDTSVVVTIYLKCCPYAMLRCPL